MLLTLDTVCVVDIWRPRVLLTLHVHVVDHWKLCVHVINY